VRTHHWGTGFQNKLIHVVFHIILPGGTIDAFIDAVYNYPALSDSYPYAAHEGLANHASWMEAKSMGP
jgi:hypothetical protein